jgi:phosphatidylglycerophosphate synthase
MRDTFLRQQKDRLLKPLVEQGFAGVHPTTVSLVAAGVGLLAAGAGWQQAYGLGLLLWLLNRTLDGLDGLVARVHGKQSDFGGYLDLFLDFVIYLAVPTALVAAQPSVAHLWALAALLGTFYLNTMSWMGLAALLEKRQQATLNRTTSMEMPTGLIEGAETIVFFALFYLLPGYLTTLYLLMTVLVLFSVGQRLWWAYWHLR